MLELSTAGVFSLLGQRLGFGGEMPPALDKKGTMMHSP